MPRQIASEGAQPCVWMSAGLVTYKMCDRRFDCDHCPLDAGLRAGTLAGSHHEGLLTPRGNAGVFPEDRLYSTGHLWLKATWPQAAGQFRLGLDAFAAAIVGHCGAVRSEVSPRKVSRGEVICQIDLGLGTLALRAPITGVVVRGNESLDSEPSRLITSPYLDGWIMEIKGLDLTELDELMIAEAARVEARMDLRRFRRRIAVQLFADGSAIGESMADGGELVTDLREMLGGSAYLELVQELIH